MSKSLDLIRSMGLDDWAEESSAIIESSQKIESPASWGRKSLYQGSIYGLVTRDDVDSSDLFPLQAKSILLVSLSGNEMIPSVDSVFVDGVESFLALVEQVRDEFEVIILSPASSVVMESHELLSDSLSSLRTIWSDNPGNPPLIIVDPDMREGYSDARTVLPRYCERMLLVD